MPDAAEPADGLVPLEPCLTVAAVARRLGMAPATLRTWDRRYGLGPGVRTAGAQRRYSRTDVARLESMRRQVQDGLPPANAARIALEEVPTAAICGESPDPAARTFTTPTESIAGPAPRSAADVTAPTASLFYPGRLDHRVRSAAAGGPGGRVLPLPRMSREVRGLARAAMGLDSDALRITLEQAIRRQGVIPTWDGLLCPVLVAIGRRWEVTGEGTEVEHLLVETAVGVFHSVANAHLLDYSPPLLLACAPKETHGLPLIALSAALRERGIGVRLFGGPLPAQALSAAVHRTRPATLLVWARRSENADVAMLASLSLLRPPVVVLAGGSGWTQQELPAPVTYVSDLTTAATLLCRSIGR